MTDLFTPELPTADNDGDIYHIMPARSNWSIKHIWLYNDAITNGTSYDVGLYTTAATPVEVDKDCYMAATTMASGRPSLTSGDLPFQTAGETTAWPASNNLTASKAV